MNPDNSLALFARLGESYFLFAFGVLLFFILRCALRTFVIVIVNASQ